MNLSVPPVLPLPAVLRQWVEGGVPDIGVFHETLALVARNLLDRVAHLESNENSRILENLSSIVFFSEIF